MVTGHEVDGAEASEELYTNDTHTDGCHTMLASRCSAIWHWLHCNQHTSNNLLLDCAHCSLVPCDTSPEQGWVSLCWCRRKDLGMLTAAKNQGTKSFSRFGKVCLQISSGKITVTTPVGNGLLKLTLPSNGLSMTLLPGLLWILDISCRCSGDQQRMSDTPSQNEFFFPFLDMAAGDEWLEDAACGWNMTGWRLLQLRLTGLSRRLRDPSSSQR